MPFAALDPAAFSNVEELQIFLQGRQPSVTPGGPVHWRNLRSLYFWRNDSSQLTDNDLECFSHCSRLEEIWVAGPVTDAGVGCLLKLPKLRTVYILDGEISDTALKDLSQIQSLERLTIYACKRITDQGIGDLVRLKKDLRRISLYRLQLTDAALEHLAQLKSLESFDITLCPHVTEQGIRRLLQLPNLKRISPRSLADFPETEELFKQRGVSVE